MYEVAICDDVPMNIDLIEDYIRKASADFLDMLEMRVHRYTAGEELLSAMKDICFSIVFMDVCLETGRMGGEEAAVRIREADQNVVLVFLTGCAEPTPSCIEVQPYRYIKKNMPPSEFSENIAAAMRKMITNASIPTIMGKVNGENIRINSDDIIYIEKGAKHVRVYLRKLSMDYYKLTAYDDEPVVKCMDKMNNLYRQLKPYGFGYPHDSYMINFKYLVSFKEDLFRLEEYPNEEFKIARSKAVEFNNLRRNFFRAMYE